MKKILLVLFMLVCVGGVWATCSNSDFVGGFGNTTSPWQIDNCTSLQKMVECPGNHFELANNVDCSDTVNWNNNGSQNLGFIPVGTSWSTRFTGSFDGNGNEITDLYVNDNVKTGVGLFGYVGSATIRNVSLIGVNTTGIGYVSGLAGYVDGGEIHNCFSGGYVESEGQSAGGLVGYLESGNVKNSYSNSDVRAATFYAGGFIGYSKGNVTNCNSTGSVYGGSQRSHGGLIGGSEGYIVNCFANCNVNGTEQVGGLVGLNFFNGYIINSHATGNTTSRGNSLGGLVGENYAVIHRSYAKGNVFSQGATYHISGLVGENRGFINYSYVDDMTITGPGYWMGGIAGINFGAHISNCYANASIVNGSNSVGGLVGGAYDASIIENSYAFGYIEGVNYVGGLVGILGSGSTYVINNSFAATTVISKVYVNAGGGLIGNYQASGQIVNSYWDICRSGMNKCSTKYSIEPSGCTGINRGYSDTSYFYNISNPPMANWSYPWSSSCSPTGYPILAGLSGQSCQTKEDQCVPVGISTCQQLQDINKSTPFGNYYLTQNVNCNVSPFNQGRGFEPIGHSGDRAFSGIFDGKGFNITGLYINQSWNYAGLFNELNGAVVKDLGLVGVDIYSTGVSAALASDADNSVIENVFATGVLEIDEYGGIGPEGGLVARSVDSLIKDSYTHMNLIVYNYPVIGGLVGDADNIIIQNSYSRCKINGTSAEYGGLIGYLDSGLINNSYAICDIYGDDYLGGLVGSVYGAAIDNSYATGNITESGTWQDGISQGGLVGDLTGSNVTNSFSAVSIYSGDYSNGVGGLVGELYSNTVIVNSYWDICRSRMDYCAGYNGSSYNATPDGCIGKNNQTDRNTNYFYNTSNPPMSSWSYPWSSSCSPAIGYPILTGLSGQSCQTKDDPCEIVCIGTDNDNDTYSTSAADAGKLCCVGNTQICSAGVDCDDDTSDDIPPCPTTPAGCDGSPIAELIHCAICINPGANEICDGVDNNCDGFVDHGLTCSCLYGDNQSCANQNGVCSGSTETCVILPSGEGVYLGCDD
ncbi:hypothetical protein KY345_04155, partial [Candidatus Woesearchaeota archaeon]|nr:hypothetical protein [Candidatus Woesearchaeota archaeon]